MSTVKRVLSAFHTTAPAPNQWSGTGCLRIADFKVDKKQYYALKDLKGGLKCYALPAPGFDIEKYRLKTIDLFGNANTSKDLRGVCCKKCRRRIWWSEKRSAGSVSPIFSNTLIASQ